jgi:TolB-like protein
MKKILISLILLFITFNLYSEEKKEPEKKVEKQGVKRSEKETKASLIVFDLVPEKGIDKGVANLLTEIIIDEVTKSNKYKVIGQKDIDKMLFWETNKQLKNCTDTSCLMQIAGAMGADYYIEGSLGQVGNNYIIALKLIEVYGVNIKGRTTRTIENKEEKLVKEIKSMVAEVIGGGATDSIGKVTKVESVSGRGFKPDIYGILATVVGLGVIGGGVYFYSEAESSKEGIENKTYNDVKSGYEDNMKVANIMLISGGLSTAGGIVYMLVGGKDKEREGSWYVINGDGVLMVGYRGNW